jgi:hypothetical protein
MHLPLVIRAIPLLLLLAAVGCGGSTATVTGKVTYKGEPVTSGSVVFYGDNGKVDSGLLDADGSYTIGRAPVGVVKVAVLASMEAKASQGGKPLGPPLGKGKPKKGYEEVKPSPEKVLKSTIPERYKDPQTSGLIYTVASGKQVINLDLKP